MRDLIGCEVRDEKNGSVIGKIQDVLQGAAQDVYVITLLLSLIHISTKAQIDKAIKTSAGNLKLTVRTSKTLKKNIKAVVKQDAALKSLLQEVKEAGYTVKYKFYRSESKKSGYAARLTKTTGVYLNTEGQANAKYY